MPIEYRIEHENRMVVARSYGVMTDSDVFGYQRDVWSRPEVEGYSELIDMTDVERIDLPSTDRVAALAMTSAKMDTPYHPSKFAIVAPHDVSFALGRMYQAYREMDPKSTKLVEVFRSMDQALNWMSASTRSE
ncbi:MAG TPA: hypothetical protein VFQ05_18670 [Candidatus Eisenbacteria bacterium]|nr:hypothetical protein [Candidatus Eisenbacteria bacterium]